MKKPSAPTHRPWHPASYSVDDVYALQNLQKGVANDLQQKRVLDFVIRSLCGTYEPTYFPDSDRDTVFAEAKRHIGLELVKFVNMPPAVLTALREKEGRAKSKEPTDE